MRTMRVERVAFVFAMAVACGPKAHAPDEFVEGGGGPIARWIATSDDRIRVPLAAGLTWSDEAATGTTRLRARAEQGPTFVVVASTPPAEGPPSRLACASAHVKQLEAALAHSSVVATPPAIGEERIGSEMRPRVHFAIALDAHEGKPAATLVSSWGYFLDADRACVGVGVSTLVKASARDATRPDDDDLRRLDRVYALIAEATVVR